MSKLFSNLEKEIQNQAQKYYTDGSNTVSDAEFDKMVEQLKEENPDSEVLKVGWGYDVHKDSTPGQKVKHKYGIVGSLDKIHSYDELPNDFKSSPILYTSLKLDGLSVVLYYRNGKLYDAVTRGDGTTGISIIDKVSYINKRYLEIGNHVNFTGAIRGEILMTYGSFKDFKKANPEAKNPRNATAGLITRKDNYEDLKYLNIVVYNIVGCENTQYIFRSFRDNISYLESWFGSDNVVPHSQLDIDDSASFDYNMERYNRIWYGNYPADGIVINVHVDYNVSTHYVSYISVAFKYPSEIKTSRVIEITWEMSKTHFAIPVVNIEPVELAGTTVENASGHNAQNIKDNLIGPGAIVEITKANEIIPHIEKVLTPQLSSGMITNCPDCGQELVWNGVHLECINDNCPNAIWQDTLQWINTIAPLDNFGDLLRKKYIEKYLDDLSIESVMSGNILRYIDLPTELKQDELFYTFIKKLYYDNISLESAIAALNIPRFGDITCRKLAQFPDVIDRIVDCATNGKDTIELLDLNGYIGDANADSIRNNIWKFTRLNLIKDRIKVSDKVEIKGKVAITGKLSVKRSDFENELRKFGYEPTTSVNKETLFLITDNPNSSSSKNKQADKFGIVKITEGDFRRKYMN